MPSPLVRALSVLSLSAGIAHAQCTTSWLPGPALAGTDLAAQTTATWDPDGPGPLGERIVVGGAFRVAGNVVAERLAVFDPTTAQWSTLPPLGLAPERTVRCILGLPNGDLVVSLGGSAWPYGILAHRWNGSTWSAMAWANGILNDLAVLPNGDLIGGGIFSTPPSPTAPVVSANLARWNGTAWMPYAGDVDGIVEDLLVTSSGDLVVTGTFSSAGGVPAANIARWNGTAWSAFGSGLGAGGTCVCERANGDLVVGGTFAQAGGTAAYRLARWNGTTWSAIGNLNAGGTIATLALEQGSGDVLAGGAFTSIGSTLVNGIAAWNGTTWSPRTTGVSGDVRCLRPLPNGGLAVAGDFTASGHVTENFGIWTGAQWVVFGNEAPGSISDLEVLPNGDLVACGLLEIHGAPHYVGIRSGGAWSALGTGVDQMALAVLPLPNGDVVVGGTFTTAGGVAASRIARWNGTTWSPLGAGCNNVVSALARMPNGDIVAAGGFTSAGGVAANSIARWNGSAWLPFGSGLTNQWTPVGRQLVVMPNGDLVVFGDFTAAGGVPALNVARWNGTNWSAMGAGLLGNHNGVAVWPNGHLVVAGYFQNGLAMRWDGVSWQPTPPVQGSLARAAIALPDGDVLVATEDSTAYGPYRVQRLDGATWSDVGVADEMVLTFAMAANGDVLVGGALAVVGNTVAPNVARYGSSCPAQASTGTGGCASSGGANTLVATSLPWLGSTFATAGSGLPASGLAVVVRGLTTTVLPLTSLLPSQPGCVLRVAPDLLDVAVPTNGTATASLALPTTTALVGATFAEQWVPLEFGAGGTITAATSTNPLTMTLGVF